MAAILVVDSSVWIESLRGIRLLDLDRALKEGRVLLAPLVAAELFSGRMTETRRAQLIEFLLDIPMHETSLDHWEKVGGLRARLAAKGVRVTIPDAHVAQCALDVDGLVWSRDKVFEQIASKWPLRLIQGTAGGLTAPHGR